MRNNKILLLLFLLPLLAGCWDERLLRDIRTVYLTGFDVDEEGEYTLTSIVRNFNISQSDRGARSISNELVSSKGENIREASLNVDRNIAGTFDPAKGRTLVLGEAVGKQNLYNVLDSIYRDPRVNVNSKIAITDGSAKQLIQHLTEVEMDKAEYFYEMIDSSEDFTEVPVMTLRTIFSYLFDEGRDFFIPYIALDQEENVVRLKGTALFRNQSFTGEFLSVHESTLLLLFMDKRSQRAILTNKLDSDSDSNISISYNVKDVSRELDIEKKDKVNIKISLQLGINVVDFPPDNLESQETINDLSEQLSSILTNKAEILFKKLAENHSDILGLGKEIIAFHPSIWEEIKGDNYYSEFVVHPEVKVTINNSGIIL